MNIVRRFVQALRDGTRDQRMVLIALACLALLAASYLTRMVLVPLLIRAYCWFVQVSLTYLFITCGVSIFSPGTGKKMLMLYWQLVEKLVLDPLLNLLGHSEKKKT